MGITASSVGRNAVDSGFEIKKHGENDCVIALAGNPNVGKSTVFNALTGMNQHTGNWPGKTVAIAQGCCRTQSRNYVMVDLPGTYSLMAHSAEERLPGILSALPRPIRLLLCAMQPALNAT